MTEILQTKNFFTDYLPLSVFHMIRRLWEHIDRPKKVQLGILLILMISASLAEVMSIGAILPFLGALTSSEKLYESDLAQPLVRYLGLSEPKQLLLPLTIIFGFFCILAGLLRLFLTWAQIRLSYNLGASLSVKIYKHTLYQPYTTHISRNSSEIISGITAKVNILVGNFINPVLTIITSTVMLVMIFGALILINPIAAISSGLGFGLTYLLVAKLTRRQLLRDGEKINYEHTKVVKALNEGLGGIRDVLIDGTQEIYVEQYRKAEITLKHSLATIQLISVSPRFIVEMLGMLLIASLAFYMTYSGGEGIEKSLPVLGALALGAQRMLPILQQTFYSWSSLKGGQEVTLEVFKLLEQSLPDTLFRNDDRELTYENQIKFSEIYFSYSSCEPWALENLTLAIPKGSRVGIIGSTGSGKTSFLDLAMGLLSPTHGHIYLDSSEVKLENCRPWQKRIAHVPQTIFLSDTTILENIALGVPKEEINLARVKEASKIAQIESTIEMLPNKYETRVGERGVQLSGGQRQRIGIARAMYKDADIIIFDEATSALDNETESLVMQAIEKLPKHITILIVAHRLTTLRNCSLIVEFAKGRVKRSGNFEEIIGI
jgi:ABC-type multidrug transport system fused ATPase/permease subunit